MKNLWHEGDANTFAHSADGPDLGLRVYSSRLLGSESTLVLHGGGNTSVKTVEPDIFGEPITLLRVKGSGSDLKTIEAKGFSPCRLDVLRRLAELPGLTDTAMARELKAAMTNPGAPSPSVEAILHALIPHKYVDHTHADVVVAISNTRDGEATLRGIFGKSVLILPYVMPGFLLARQVWEATRSINWASLKGIVLMHHGVLTFGRDARESYTAMIGLVSKAEDHLAAKGVLGRIAQGHYEPTAADFVAVATLRREAAQLFGAPLLARWRRDSASVGYSCLANIETIATRGPVTPDHALHTKRVPAVVEADPTAAVAAFAASYNAYFARHHSEGLTRLDPAPRLVVWKGKGNVALAPNPKRIGILSDLLDCTMRAVQWGEGLGGWQALSEAEIFAVEYWELEQAKLGQASARKELEGKVVLVTGAAMGIGAACVEAFVRAGAAVIALDINPAVQVMTNDAVKGLLCDVTRADQVQASIEEGVAWFGGLDVVVSNAGAFPPSMRIEDMDAAVLAGSMGLNFTSHLSLIQQCLPFLKLGFEPAIILIASKNVPAPGPGAGAYSAAKAALTQLGRVAALEFGQYGIRVNIVHPNAVFDTGVWSSEVLAARAAEYNLSVPAYKMNNVLRREVRASDVGALVVAMAGPAFALTTGAQVPIDGGNDRVI